MDSLWQTHLLYNASCDWSEIYLGHRSANQIARNKCELGPKAATFDDVLHLCTHIHAEVVDFLAEKLRKYVFFDHIFIKYSKKKMSDSRAHNWKVLDSAVPERIRFNKKLVYSPSMHCARSLLGAYFLFAEWTKLFHVFLQIIGN